jgi:tryptophanyl-tRNA synthetase
LPRRNANTPAATLLHLPGLTAAARWGDKPASADTAPHPASLMGLVFSGIQPTGNLHLGNYLGAIRNWVKLQQAFDCIFCIVDLHAVTVWQNPQDLRAQTREVAAALMAAGIDPAKHILFVQSQVPAHAELAWLFGCVARFGWLGRMTQFKEKAASTGRTPRSGCSSIRC